MKLLPTLLMLLATAQAHAVVYRCPGPPVLYTDQLSPREAQEKGCRSIEGAPITVVSPAKSKAPTPAAGGGAADKRERVADDTQRARDSERRKVLEAELREATAKLEQLKKDFNDGQPERTERNFAVYQQKVTDMRAAIARQEVDIEALKRELAKLP
ncbi:hypothetical protein [Inhella sp.]|uniref:hypothetical protein n=1 Tax=Inhella sp. TaxID=1921806 RepID=UPI0035AFB46A